MIHPEIRGVTGIRDYSDQKSAFCVKKDVSGAFEEIIEKAKFENIILSYSSEGLMTFEEIEEILKDMGSLSPLRGMIFHTVNTKAK